MIDRSKGDDWQPGLRHIEHITIRGDLSVPVARSIDRTPKREGWKPRWVNINLNDERTQKQVLYSRTEEEQHA
jgi:hypothetical protein